MIKKLILLSILLSFSTTLSFSYTNPQKQIESFESIQFNTIFLKDSTDKRLDRLEKDIFGKTFNQTTTQRINRLKDEIMIPKIDPSQFTFLEPNINESTSIYPAITTIEEQLFRKAYSNENIYNRLNRLEKLSFGQIYDYDNLYNRTERITAKYKPHYKNFVYENPNRFKAESTTSYSDENTYDSLAKLEYNFLHKNYLQEPASIRVERLEKAVLGAVQSGDINKRISVLSQALTNRPMSNTIDYYNKKYNNWNDDFYNNSSPSLGNKIKGMWQNFGGSSSGTTNSTINPNNSTFEDDFFKQTFSNMGGRVQILPD